MKNAIIIKRLAMNELAMENSYEKLLKSLKSTNDTEIYIALSEVLAWIANTHEWHFKINKTYSVNELKESADGSLLLGLTHANNMIKHTFNFIHEHQLVHHTTLPQTLPFYAVAEYCWIVAGNEFKGKYENQKENYDKYVAGKGILGTCRLAIDYLKKENAEVFRNQK